LYAAAPPPGGATGRLVRRGDSQSAAPARIAARALQLRPRRLETDDARRATRPSAITGWP